MARRSTIGIEMLRRLAHFFIGALLCGCAAAPSSDESRLQPAPLSTSPASVPEIRPGFLASYLGRDLPDSLLLIPAPPAENTAAFEQDQSVSRASQRLRGTPRYAQATADAGPELSARGERVCVRTWRPHHAGTLAASLSAPAPFADRCGVGDLCRQGSLPAHAPVRSLRRKHVRARRRAGAAQRQLVSVGTYVHRRPSPQWPGSTPTATRKPRQCRFTSTESYELRASARRCLGDREFVLCAAAGSADAACEPRFRELRSAGWATLRRTRSWRRARRVPVRRQSAV